MGKKLCYFCDEVETGKEHLPPRMLFTGLPTSTDALTVPSCNLHNTEKSKQDQDIVSFLANALDFDIARGRIQPSPHLQSAIDHIKGAKQHVQHSAHKGKLRVQTILDPEVSYLNFNPDWWFRQLSAGLVYFSIHRRDHVAKWRSAEVWTPVSLPPHATTEKALFEFVKFNQEKESFYLSLNWVSGWSSQPRNYPYDIFRFDLCKVENNVVFRHVFFDCLNWYVSVELEPSTYQQLIRTAKAGRYIPQKSSSLSTSPRNKKNAPPDE